MSLVISALRVWFSSWSCFSFVHVWGPQRVVVVVVVDMAGVVLLFYGSRQTALTFFPIHSLGTRILAEVAQGLAVFSMTS